MKGRRKDLSQYDKFVNNYMASLTEQEKLQSPLANTSLESQPTEAFKSENSECPCKARGGTDDTWPRLGLHHSGSCGFGTSIIPSTRFPLITSMLKSLVILAMWLVLSSVIYSQIALSFALNHIFFLGQWEWHRKTKQPVRFQGFF